MPSAAGLPREASMYFPFPAKCRTELACAAAQVTSSATSRISIRVGR